MKTFVITLLLVGFGLITRAQIHQIEYGWDTDKGHGLNTVVNLATATNDADVNLNVLASGLANGYHTLFVRTRDARSRWSHTYLRLVNIRAGGVPAKIVKVDYVYSRSATIVSQHAYTIPNPAASVQLTVPGDVSQLTAGQTYTLTIWATDENGARSQAYSQSFTYRMVDCKGLAVTTQGVSALCTGGNAVLTATTSGGNAPLSISWLRATTEVGKATSLTITQAGTYTARVTDAQGCVVSAVQSVTESPGLPVSITGNNVFCQGSNTTLTATVSGGTSPFSYQWKQSTTNVGTSTTSYTASAAGSYSVEVADSRGCKGTAPSLVVTQRPAPAIPTISTSTSAITTGQTTTLQTTVTAGLTIQWLLNNTPISGAIQLSYATTQGGNYAARVTNSEGCSSTSQTLIVNLITANEEPLSGSDFSLSASPNPSSGAVEIRLSSQRGRTVPVTLVLRDLFGRALYQKPVKVTGEHVEKVDLSQLPAGVLLLNATTEKQQTSLRLIRQ